MNTQGPRDLPGSLPEGLWEGLWEGLGEPFFRDVWDETCGAQPRRQPGKQPGRQPGTQPGRQTPRPPVCTSRPFLTPLEPSSCETTIREIRLSGFLICAVHKDLGQKLPQQGTLIVGLCQGSLIGPNESTQYCLFTI